jgi:hypothetical protein
MVDVAVEIEVNVEDMVSVGVVVGEFTVLVFVLVDMGVEVCVIVGEFTMVVLVAVDPGVLPITVETIVAVGSVIGAMGLLRLLEHPTINRTVKISKIEVNFFILDLLFCNFGKFLLADKPFIVIVDYKLTPLCLFFEVMVLFGCFIIVYGLFYYIAFDRFQYRSF